MVHDLTDQPEFRPARRAVVMGVFDGHAGHEAAEHLASHFVPRLLQSEYLGTQQYGAALREALMALEEELMVQHFVSGSTALVVLMVDLNLYLANVGDCRAVVSDGANKTLALTKDHKPSSNEDERKRLQEQGAQLSADGYVQLVVDGCECTDIMLSRALGGAHIKKSSANLASIPESGSHHVAYTRSCSDLTSSFRHARSSTSSSVGQLQTLAEHLDVNGQSNGCTDVHTTTQNEHGAGISHSNGVDSSYTKGSAAGHANGHTNGHSASHDGASSSGMNDSGSLLDLRPSGLVIPDPEMFHYDISQNSEFVVIASDGVWDKVRHAPHKTLHIIMCHGTNNLCHIPDV